MTTPPAELLADLPAEDYHLDEVAEVPTLSASIASILCAQSPAHAKAAHPQLNPHFERKAEQKFDLGNATHSIFLQGLDSVFVVHADSWRTNDAKAARDEARAAGKIPLLAHDRENVYAMIDAMQEQLAVHKAEPPLFADGAPEQTLVWEEQGVTCRARLDWLRHDVRTCDDLKTTSRSANPAAYSKALFAVGGDVQAAMYVRGVRALTGAEPTFRWCVVETTPPYALSVITPDPATLELGNAKVEYAIRRWRECLAADEWPGYPSDVVRAECPSWEMDRWLMREEAA